MDNLIYYKPERWKVKLVMNNNWKVIYSYDYKKDEYEYSYLIFVNPKNDNERIYA